MKSLKNSRKYFLVLITLALIFSVILTFKEKFVDSKIDTLRIGMNLADLILPIDPIKNTTITNAFYVNHMYSNLVRVNDYNEYVPDLAEKFYWQKNTLVMEFAKDSIANAQDAEFSLRRTFINTKNDHGDLWRLICSDSEDAESCLNRVYAKDDKLFIDVSNELNIAMVIPLLASINNKIVPKSAFDTDDLKTAKIIDYSKTSGFYHLKNNDTYILYSNNKKLNPGESDVQKIQIVDANLDNLVKLMENKLIDAVSTTVTVFENQLDQIKSLKWNIFLTHNIKVTYITFNEKATEVTSVNERKLIGDLIKKEISKSKALFAEPADQFFQSFGQGYLSADQITVLQSINESQSIKSEVVYYTNNIERWTQTFLEHPKVKIKKISSAVLKEVKTPCFYGMSNDVSFDVSYSQISYLLKNNLFRIPNKTADQILNEYLHLKSNEDKLSFIQKLHFEVLKSLYIIPLWSSPYITLASPDYEYKGSKFTSRTLAWKIFKK